MTLLATAVGFLAGAGACWLFFSRKERMLEKYFSFLAHELNTQVTGLQLTVENLLSGVFGPLNDEHRKWVGAIEHRVDLLGCMIGDFRDMAHWEFGGQVRLIPEPVSLQETVDREMKRLAGTAARSKVALDSRLPEDLPRVHVDPYRLKRAVSSVLHNVLKFAETQTTLALQARTYEGKVVFQVTYKPAEPVAAPGRMLDLHYSVEQKGQALVSVGAGLGVCARVLREMGGDMQVSLQERGLITFTFLLPISKESEPSDKR